MRVFNADLVGQFASQTGRGRRARTALVAALFGLSTLCASAQVLIDGHVIAGGGGTSRSAGGCLILDGTMGEPVTGQTSGGNFSLAAGFWASVGADKRDTLFNSGFEGCQ